MAYSSNPGYEDMESPAASGSEESKGGMEEEHEDKDKGQEYPLPIGVLAGKADEFNVGDELIVEITAKHPDQIFVRYATGDKDKSSEKSGDGMEEEASSKSSGADSMSSLYE